MTDKDMNKLADLIVDKILKRQAEYDANFLKQVSENMGEDFDISIQTSDSLSVYKQKLSTEDQIQALRDEIDYCIETENFEKIKLLEDKIKKLSNGDK